MLMIGTLTVGEFIKKIRTQRKLSQHDLAIGIFNNRTVISKIENGHFVPSYEKLVLLVERLGFGADCIGENHHQDIKELNSYSNSNKFDKMEELITALEKNDDFMDSIYNRQALMVSNIIVMREKDAPTESVRTIILSGLKITLRNFDEKKIADYLLTVNDIKLINQLAILYWKIKNTDAAIRLMHDLIKNLETNCADVRFRKKMLPWLYYNLSKYLYDTNRYSEEIPLLDRGIAFCRESNSLFYLPHLIGNKAWCKYRLGNDTEAFPLFVQAYYTYSAYTLYDNRDIVRNFVLKHYGADLHLHQQILFSNSK